MLYSRVSKVSIPTHSHSDNCIGHVPPSISCLFAKTRSRASLISRSRMILCNSWRASSMRLRSFESMTKIRPWVPKTPQIAELAIESSQGLRVDPIRTREVMPPQWPDLVLPTNIPDIELDILVCDTFDVKSNRGDRSDVLIELQLVEDCCEKNKRQRQFLGMDPSGSTQDKGKSKDQLVFPAASSPNINRRISFDPKILPITFETCPPIVCELSSVVRWLFCFP